MPLQNIEKNATEISPSPEEKDLVKKLIYFSIALHIAFLLFDFTGLLDKEPVVIKEWSIDTEFISETELIERAKQTKVPKAQVKKEPAINKKTLPQLPKVFKIKKEEKIEETSEKAEKKEPVAAIESLKKQMELEKKKKQEEIKQKEQEAIELSKKDALRRLAMERLKKQKDVKNKPKPETPKKTEKLALNKKGEKEKTLEDILNSGQNLSSDSDDYGTNLKRYLRPKYNIPLTFKLKKEVLEVTIGFIISSTGELQSVKVTNSSGDSLFDNHIIKMLQEIISYPRPSAIWAGNQFEIKFNNRSK